MGIDRLCLTGQDLPSGSAMRMDCRLALGVNSRQLTQMNCEAPFEKSEIIYHLRLPQDAGRNHSAVAAGKLRPPEEIILIPKIQEVTKENARKDRRATPRFQAKPENHFTYGERSAPIRDLSLEGVFVLDPDPFPAGSEITFTLQAGQKDITLEGIVRHSVDRCRHGNSIHEPLCCIEKTVDHTHCQLGFGSMPHRGS